MNMCLIKFLLKIIGNNIKNLLLIFIFFITSCEQKKLEDEIEEINQEIDTIQFRAFLFGNTVFSLPSPYEIAFLVKRLNVLYNKDLLNPYNKTHNYISAAEKALSLGVYGADLGYLTLYDQTSDAIQYFSTIKLLMQELNIENAIDRKIVDRIERNLGNKDSLINIVTSSYRKADEYLKNSERNDIAALILTGGWIESIYILSELLKNNPQQELKTRLGEQKYIINNLIKILSSFYQVSPEISEITDELVDLAYDFDAIEIKYTYQPPITDTINKITIVNSKTEIYITDEQIEKISNKIKKLRNKVVKI